MLKYPRKLQPNKLGIDTQQKMASVKKTCGSRYILSEAVIQKCVISRDWKIFEFKCKISILLVNLTYIPNAHMNIGMPLVIWNVHRWRNYHTYFLIPSWARTISIIFSYKTKFSVYIPEKDGKLKKVLRCSISMFSDSSSCIVWVFSLQNLLLYPNMYLPMTNKLNTKFYIGISILNQIFSIIIS